MLGGAGITAKYLKVKEMNDYYEKKAKDSEELAVLWCWVCAVGALVAVCVAVVKWIIALITA